MTAWRDALRTKKKDKAAASIAHPDEDARLFEEGWEAALAREAESRTGRVAAPDG